MRRLALSLCLLCLGGAAPAAAQEQIAPPGNAGVDEYLETIPEAGGNRAVRPGTGDREERSGGGALDSDTRRELESLGDDGREAARLADQTAQRSEDAGSGPSTGAGGAPSGAGLDGRSGAGLGTVLGQTVSAEDGGMGIALPAILLAALLAAVGLLVLRRRRSGP